jgi:RNA polymerase sigma-70 factor (ECF subfamily)
LIPESIMPHPEGSTTDVSLLLRLNHEPLDQAAWGEFVDRYGAKIYDWCRTWHLQEADARDVTQTVLAKLVVQLRRFAYDPTQSFRGWLRTVALNAYRDWRADRQRVLGGATGDSEVEERIQTVEAREDLARRLEEEFDLELLDEAERRVRRRVAPHTWDAYRLTAIEGLAGAAAAARLGMKVATVFVSKSHVMRHLRDEVQALEWEHEASPPRG